MGGRFGYFLFFLLGTGERGVRGAARGWGTIFLLKIPGGGGVSRAGWGGASGREGVCAEFGGGGGAKYFFFGAEIPTKNFGVQETVLLVNHAFARGTPAIFVIFVDSWGLSSKALVLVVKMQIRHFRRLRQNPPLFGGTKARFTKSTVSWTKSYCNDFEKNAILAGRGGQCVQAVPTLFAPTVLLFAWVVLLGWASPSRVLQKGLSLSAHTP